jgi:urease gamma subunit
MIGRNLVQPGVEKMVNQITVEATFNDGLKTVEYTSYF